MATLLSAMNTKLSLYLFIIFASVNVALTKTVPVKVGVVLDMDTYVGKMGLKCIEMALSDFYAANSHFKSRLVLRVGDSKNDVVGAAFAALDLLKNVQVLAIIGPLTSSQANFIISLGDKAHVPIITFSATSPSLASMRSPYFVRATLSDSSQVQAIASIVRAFSWREVVLIYVDNVFGEGAIPFLTDALEQINTRVPYRSAISPSATDDQIAAELYKLMTMQTRVFVVHMLTGLGARLFTKANELGMMSTEYAWIVTDGIASELTALDNSIMQSMLGVIGVRPYVPDSQELNKFTHQYKRLNRHNGSDINVFGLRAYDSATALALAVENAAPTISTLTTYNVSRNYEDLGVSRAGMKVVQALRDESFRGLAGNFSLVDGQLPSPPYEIINFVGPAARVVGYWTQENGIVRDLSQTNNNNDEITASRSNLGSIIWPGDTTIPPKGWVIPTNRKKLRIGVPVKDRFREFIQVIWNSDNSTQVTGYCIDVFEAAIRKLSYGLQMEYVPFANSSHQMAGTYNDLVYQVYLGNFDAAVGDITIIANRSRYVDFTLPYTESGVYIVVPIKDDKSNNVWAFLKPLTWQLWLTSFSSFVFIGLLVWILEHRINQEFRGSFSNQVGTIFWFAFSTMVFAHKERIKSNWTRSLLIIWFLLVLILTQSYTASLSSLLTVRQLQPTVTDVDDLLKSNKYVGYHSSSFVLELLKSIGFPESRLFAYGSSEELDELLSNGTIAAAFDEIPYMKLFLAQHCTKYTTINPIYKTDGFAFALPIGSPLASDISRAILNVTEGNEMTAIERKWFGDKTTCQDSGSLIMSNSLGLESFWGLFVIVGGYSILVFVIHMTKFLCENWNDTSNTLLQNFISKDQTFERRDCCCRCMHRASRSPNDNNQSNPTTVTVNSPRIDSQPTPAFSSPNDQNVSIQDDINADASQRESVDQPEEESHPTTTEDELVDPNRNQR